jgi:hypothetical protein
MISRIRFAVVTLSLCIVQTTFAQFRLPSFDIEVKANQIVIPGEGRRDGELKVLESTNMHCGVHVHFGQRLALGVYYSKSFRGTSKISYGDGTADIQRDALTAIRGIDLRLSGNRARSWRPHISANFSIIEIVQDNESHRVAGKSPVYGINFGLMKKLSNRLYLNVIELGVKYINDKMFWFDNNGATSYPLGEAKMGLTYNIGKRK